MKVLGLDLDNSPHIAQDKSLRYAKNITIDNKGQSYFNERGFDFIGELDDILENHPTIGISFLIFIVMPIITNIIL